MTMVTGSRLLLVAARVRRTSQRATAPTDEQKDGILITG